MNSSIKLSIIIPAYNVEPYIYKCISSCLRQDLSENEYEVIVINDGSTDRTLNVLETLSKKHTNIKIFSKKNEGLGKARNDGIEISRGEYLWFVDSDDWIEDNCIGELYTIASTNLLDLLWFNLQRVQEGDGTIKKITNARSKNYSILEGPVFLDNVMGYSLYSVLFLIKRDFLINFNLRFRPGIYYEDAEFIPRMILSAKKVKYEPITVYNYLNRNGSILQSATEKKINDLMIVIALLDELRSNLSENYGSKFISIFLSRSVLGIFRLVSNPAYANKRRELLEEFRKNRISKMRISGNFNQRIQLAVFKLSPLLYLKICVFARHLR